MQDLLGDKIYVYLVAAGGAILLISARLPIFADNIGKLFASMRRTAQLRDDSDIASLERQVSNLEAKDRKRDERELQQNARLEEHADWDRDIYRTVQVILTLLSPEQLDDVRDKIVVRLPPPLL